MRDRTTAFHEAGHATFASMRGYDIRRVLLQPHRDLGPDEGGRCEVADAAAEIDAYPADFLIYLLAGAAAERRLVGRTSDRADFDVRQAREVAASALQQDPASEAVSSIVASATALAHAKMCDDRIWKWVDVTARRLLKRGVLTHRDVQLAGDDAGIGIGPLLRQKERI
jgi:hypothetical protein